MQQVIYEKITIPTNEWDISNILCNDGASMHALLANHTIIVALHVYIIMTYTNSDNTGYTKTWYASYKNSGITTHLCSL